MLVLDRKPNSKQAEAYRTLRTNVVFSDPNNLIKTILVTSAEKGDGKSVVAGNLAIALSKEGRNVVLVDCDLRDSSIAEYFGIESKSGLTDIIRHGKRGVLGDGTFYNQRLKIIPAGKLTSNPSELLSSNRMAAYLEELRGVYDYVVIDTPPLSLVTDAQILANKADGTILVVKADKTKKEEVKNAVSLLRNVNANIIGTVLNKDRSKGWAKE